MQRTALAAALVATLTLSAPPARADLPPGDPVVDGVMADITPAGLDFIVAQLEPMIPTELPLPDQIVDDEPFWGCTFHIEATNILVHLQPQTIDVTPMQDVLRVNIAANVWLNTQGDPMGLYLDGGDWLCGFLNETCNVWTDPILVTLQMDIQMQVIDPGNGDPPYLDVVVPPLQHNIDTAITSDKIHLDDCGIGYVVDFLDILGIDLVDLLLDTVMGDLTATLDELPATIEEALEDAFADATIEDSLEVLDATVDYKLWPSDVAIQPEGLRIAMAGQFDAAPAACIAEFDPGGSPFTDNPPPGMDGMAAYHARALIADDLVAAALYTFWRSGVLCYTADPADLGFPLDTSIIALMVDEEDREQMERIWLGKTAPILLHTVPKNPPQVPLGGANDVDAVVEDLGLQFYALTQDRMAHVMQVDVDVAAGINVDAPGDGSIAIDIAVDSDNLNPVVAYNEMTPELSEQIETNFGDIMSGLLDTVLDSFLPDLSFPQLHIAGIGLSQLDMGTAGPGDDYLAAEATLDLVKPECEGDLTPYGIDMDNLISCEDGGGGGMSCSGTGDDDDSAGSGDSCSSCSGTGDDDDSAANPCACDAGCDDSSCGGCDADGQSRLRGIWTGNAMLLAACVGVWIYLRRRG